MIEALLGDGPIAAITTGGDPLSRKLDKIKRLADVRANTDVAARLKDWGNQSKRLSERRNYLFHSAWGAIKDALYLYSGRPGPVRFSLGELTDFAAEIKANNSDGFSIKESIIGQSRPEQ
jgi:hypothetical protein